MGTSKLGNMGRGGTCREEEDVHEESRRFRDFCLVFVFKGGLTVWPLDPLNIYNPWHPPGPPISPVIHSGFPPSKLCELDDGNYRCEEEGGGVATGGT